MLTKKTSSRLAKARFWLVVPVLLTGLFCCAKAHEKHEKKKTGPDTIVYKGNTFGLTKLQKASIMMTDPKTGKQEETEVELSQYPVQMNGKKIYDYSKVDQKPVYAGGSLGEKIIAVVKPELEQLADADNYTISIFDMILDEKGNLVYYNVRGLEQYFQLSDPDKGRLTIDPALKASVNTKVDEFLDGSHTFTPAILDGKAVVCTAPPIPLNFAVKNHQLAYHPEQ